MADLIFEEICKRFPRIVIEMDSNPILYAELRKKIRHNRISGVKIREQRSRSSRLIQVADYVVNISAKVVKYPETAVDKYTFLTKKAISFKIVG